jgi:SHS2 domain-containing protein
MEPQFYRIIEHTADIGFEVQGKTREQVFESAALAFFHIMWRIGRHKKSQPEIITVKSNDLQELLVNFLEEFLYLYDAKRLICCQLKVFSMSNNEIRVKAWLQQFDDNQDQELLAVKAVTYHQLYIGKKDHGWSAQVFLDI